jgi:hypothetical protein
VISLILITTLLFIAILRLVSLLTPLDVLLLLFGKGFPSSAEPDDRER